MSDAAFAPQSPSTGRRGGRKLAFTSFALALLAVIGPLVLLFIWVPIDGSEWQVIGWMLFAPIVALIFSPVPIASLIVAIVCLARRARGRGWAIAAIVIDGACMIVGGIAVASFVTLVGQTG